jgi:hypothetical protein
MNIKDFLYTGSKAWFAYYRAGFFYYHVYNGEDGIVYSFPVPADDLGGATLEAEHKTITLMRWLRKGIDEGTIVKVNEPQTESKETV